ncbi:hypothetical protein D9619_010739 [Psilocybe cf. subviscida]|uniref:Uncharacterized protein n=1 Tax=Psilocybe cf. subviscida TaxID=2480587 RepID=A0A8H5B870_9AGAR|nr:hypothetical protein D9619_010739 [Psilocybe cf. subviscida]
MAVHEREYIQGVPKFQGGVQVDLHHHHTASTAAERRWPSLSEMEHQVRRGIYRQKAQRLSIALAPVAAHRSLLFNQVRADLASKASYSELSPRSNDSDSEYEAESPALFMMTPQPQKMSAIISAKSAASMYSQDSWSNRSAFMANDNRRHAIAVSPSLQLADLLKEGTVTRGRPLPTLPLRSAPLSALSRTGFEGVSKVPSPQRGLFEALTPTLQTATVAMMQMPIPEIHVATVQEWPEQPPVVQAPPRKPLPEIKTPQNGLEVVLDTVATDSEGASKDTNVEPPSYKPLPEVKDSESRNIASLDVADETKRTSKHTKAFGKVLSRISMQATKKEIAHRIRMESISHPMPPMPPLPALPSLPTKKSSIDDLKLTLPDVPKVEPIRTSFIAKVAARPITFAATHASIIEEGAPIMTKKRLSPTEARDKERRRRTTMPPTPTSVKRSLESPMLAVPPMALRAPPPRRPITGTGQHRRAKSSPTVMQAPVLPLTPQRRGRNRRWDLENMPPLPPLPPLPNLAVPTKSARPTLPLVPARTRSDSVGPLRF